MMDTSPREAGFFYRRIGGTLFKVRVYTGSGYADTLILLLVTDFHIKRITLFTNGRKTATKTEVFLKKLLQNFIFLQRTDHKCQNTLSSKHSGNRIS